jgi:hypothetical protein
MKRLFSLLLLPFALFASCDLFNSVSGDDSVKITGISFSKNALSVSIGSDEYLQIKVTPADAQNKVKLSWEYDSEIISIKPDSYGVVISGLKPLSTYIKASFDGYTATCIVNVSGSDNYIGLPYIYSGSGIVEIQPQGTQNISVSLMGGTATDFSGFQWSSSDNMVANITSAMNNCVIRSYKTGTAQIEVSHPLSQYPYTFIVHSYSDDFKTPFLTTNENIITINKTESVTKYISVSIQNNNGSPGSNSLYRWEIDSNGSQPCISLTGNGNTGIVTALSNGINRIKVSYEGIDYPLYILVRVTTSVSNVYVTTSVSTLEVIGSSRSYSVSANLEGFNGYFDKAKFVWELPDDVDNYADCFVYENNLSITGKVNTVFKVRVSHELSDFSKTVLVILHEQDGSRIDNTVYITTDKNYIQTKIGAPTIPVSVTLVGGNPGDENNFVWTVDGGRNNVFVKFETTHGSIASRAAFGSLTQGTLYITPLKIGSVTVSVSHPKSAYSTDIAVKVFSENAQIEEPLYINCSVSSLKLLGGSSEPLSVTLSGNISPGDENLLSWSSSDPSLVSFTPSSGTNVIMNVAYGKGPKQTYITISHPNAQSSKRILLLSADSQKDLDSMKALYTDQTYYRINVNSSANISINSVGLDNNDIIEWQSSPVGIVIVNKDSSNQFSAAVKGVSSGTAIVTAQIRNSNSAPCELTFAVLPENESIDTISAQYLSTVKNAVLLAEPGYSADLTVYGVNIPAGELYKTSWSGFDNSVISVSANGASASITALNYGSTKIKISHPDSAIDLFIDVKIGALYSWTEELFPYITVESDVILMVKGDKNKTIGASLVNHQALNGFSFRLNPSTSNVASISGFTNGTCVIDTLEAGMCEIVISNIYCGFEREVLLVVANSPEELAGFNFLTTSQNVITIPSGSPVTVSVSIPNIANPSSGSFFWESNDPTVASIVSSGHFAVVSGGQKTGTAIITVRQNDCQYPLEIIANVVDPKLAASNPYIMSPNLITLRVGDQLSSIACELVGGNKSDNTFFTWTCGDPSIIDLYGSNESAQIRAKREGITQIRISHPKTAVERCILVICEPKFAYEYAISLSESIIRMSPSDSARSVTASLLNGTPVDIYGFKWWADSYDIIDFSYSSNTCVITPKSAGSVYIHASHPKSAYTADILVQISQFSEFKFAQQSMTIAAGSQSFVNIQVPVYNFTVRVNYEAVDPVSGANASHIASASGTSSVCTVNALSPGNVVLQAKLVNASNGIVQATAQLLVNVTPSSTPATYINYSGQTIITIEKGASRQLSATLAGLGAVSEDNNSLQWKTSDWFSQNGSTVNPNRAVTISPSPSVSGSVVNNSIQITGLTAGTECTVTISHNKAASDIVLYIIVPGINAANISLSTGSAKYCIQGEPAFQITATISNPDKNDYDLLQWKLDQSSDVLNLSGSGKNIYILPKNPGTAVVTAIVPSSLRTASCTVTVDKQYFISLEYSFVKTYPGQSFTFTYQVSPPELADCVSWEVADQHYVHSMVASNNTVGRDGTMQIMGWNNSGSTTLTATLHQRDNKNIILAKTFMTIQNGWDHKLSVSTSQIKHNPVKPSTPTIAQNPFTVSYEVNPPNSEIHVVIPNSNLILKDGTYSSKKDANTYVIKQDKLYKTDVDTGIGYGYIQLEPVGETSTTINVYAVNQQYFDPTTQIVKPETFPSTYLNIQCDIYYSSYSFNATKFSVASPGNPSYSYIDESIGAIVIGDGQTMDFTLSALEPNAYPSFGTITKKQNGGNTTQYGYITVSKVSGTTNRYRIIHSKDYTDSGTPYPEGSPKDPLGNKNPAQVGFVLAGTIEIPYTTSFVSSQNNGGTVFIQVYVSIRNCPASGPAN